MKKASETALIESEVVDRYLRAIESPDRLSADAFERLERQFIAIAGNFSATFRICREAWIDAGVTPELIDNALLSHSRHCTPTNLCARPKSVRN
jgi:hypothetical protein